VHDTNALNMQVETISKTETGRLARGGSQEFFATEHLKADLKGRSVRGGAVTVAAQGAQFFLRMGSTVVLARLLTPQDYGLIAMVIAVTGFILMFKDMGLSMATVQKDEINHGQISTLFWINVLLSFGVMLVTAALAPVITWFYGEPRLTWITLALAGAFIFGGLTVQHQALLRRQMRFGSLALIQIVSLSVSILVAIISAWCGAGYWALVLMYLAEAIAGAIGVWVACRWRPGLPVHRAGVRSMLAFGGYLTGFNFMNYFARNADNILIGKFWGSGPLGLYSKAYSLLMLPITQITSPITAVAVPTLSCLQNDPERYRRYYYRAVNMIAFMSMPLTAMLAVLSEEIVRIVLGNQWTDAAIIFKMLAFVAFVQPVTGTVGWVFVSLGQTKRLMYWGLISVPIVVLSFIIGLPWGPVGVATSYTICTLFTLTVPALSFAFRYSPINLVGFFKAVWCPLTIGLIMYASLELAKYYLAFRSSVWTILYCSITALLVTILCLILWPRARDEALNTLGIVKMLRSPKFPV
jgi:PST family polysaccharide transporter